MINSSIASNLTRYFREMMNQATSHDKIVLLLTTAIWIGCGYGAYQALAVSRQWSKGLLLALGVVVGLVIWLLSFSLGVMLRPQRWSHVFPPFRLMGIAAVPALVISMITGSVAGTALFKISLSQSIGASFMGYGITFFASYILFLMHAPFTRTAVRITRNPNIMTVDSHRYLWLFPALGVLALFFLLKRLLPVELETAHSIVITAAITTSTVFAGFGAGYIP